MCSRSRLDQHRGHPVGRRDPQDVALRPDCQARLPRGQLARRPTSYVQMPDSRRSSCSSSSAPENPAQKAQQRNTGLCLLIVFGVFESATAGPGCTSENSDSRSQGGLIGLVALCLCSWVFSVRFIAFPSVDEHRQGVPSSAASPPCGSHGRRCRIRLKMRATFACVIGPPLRPSAPRSILYRDELLDQILGGGDHLRVSRVDEHDLAVRPTAAPRRRRPRELPLAQDDKIDRLPGQRRPRPARLVCDGEQGLPETS